MLPNTSNPPFPSLSALPSADAVTRELHRRSFYAFFVDLWPEMEPAAPYIEAKHIRVLCDHFQALFEGRFLDLSIEIGPGHAKSLVSAVAYPAWVWATQDPSHRFGFSTYAGDLTTRDSARCRDLIKSEKYQRLYGHVFQLVKEREDYLRNSRSGMRLALSVKGQTIGHRANTWICDDLLNLEASKSDAERLKVKNHLKAVATRGQIGKPYRRVIIGQRLHEDDPGGYARENGYTVLCLPTEYDPSRHCVTPIFEDWRRVRGELLFPTGFGPDKVARAKQDLGNDYSAQHQQLPVPAEGGVLKPAYVQLFKPNARPKAAFYFISVDTAQGTDEKNDTTAITVWGVFKEGVFLADGWTGRAPADKVLDMLYGNPEEGIEGFGPRYRPAVTVVEAKDWGKALMALLESSKRWRWPLLPYVPLVSKDMRAHQAQPFFFRRRIWMEEGHPLTEAALAQLGVFPKSKVRDLADAIVQAAIHADSTYTFETIDLPIEYEGEKRASAGKGSIYDDLTDDDEDDW